MLNFMLGAGALCLLLNALDLLCAIKRSVRQRSRRKLLVQKVFEEERYYTSQRAEAGAPSLASQVQQARCPSYYIVADGQKPLVVLVL